MWVLAFAIIFLQTGLFLLRVVCLEMETLVLHIWENILDQILTLFLLFLG